MCTDLAKAFTRWDQKSRWMERLRGAGCADAQLAWLFIKDNLPAAEIADMRGPGDTPGDGGWLATLQARHPILFPNLH